MSDLAERIASFERALVEMLAKRSWAKREQWCGCIDCHSMIAPRALRPSSAPRRPDPTPDKINEAFEQALDAEMVAYRPLHATWWRKMLTALVLLCSIGTTDCRQLADAPDQSALPLTYGMEEAAKHPVPANNYVKVACVHKGVAPDYPVVAAWAGFLLFVGAGAFALGTAIHNEASAQQHAPRPEQI